MAALPVTQNENWIADDAIKACESCKSSFGIFGGKHHCRLCGHIFCSKCASQKVVLPEMYGFAGAERVCDACALVASGRAPMPSSNQNEGPPAKRGLKDTGVDDLVMLTKISEDAIVDNLKKRFNNDMIYTYIGHVLVSVNPFKMIKNLYSDRTLLDYKGKFPYELPPHVYCLTDGMYRDMKNNLESQCVIISGESGAGKTEASKRIMQFIAAVSGSSGDVVRVKDVILESNPLLEAFGNAKTLRNNNSSRFGKYMEIQFNRAGDPVGGRISNYLLEKSRVVYQQGGERNFHVFYQMLAGCPADYLSGLGLGGGLHPNQFYYLCQSNCFEVDGIDDREEFQDTLKAMTTMTISRDEQLEILRLIFAILYLGNIEFGENNKEESYISNPDALESFAYMLRTDAKIAEKALCTRTMSTGTEGRSARVSVYSVPQNTEGALYSRDALAKSLYSKLFDYIIRRVNESMYLDSYDDCVIGVLDIYGFEIFGKNGFEQLCINYVNERLQQIFIELTLKAEQEEYHAEGIKWEDIKFFNNKICCDLIESKKPIGLLAILDDTCNFPKGTDEKFLEKMKEAFGSHAHFQGVSPTEFIIKHYAGDVTYCAEGFCDKNKDLLFNDLIDLAQTCRSPFVVNLFPESATKDDKKRPTTAGFKIKESIGLLVTTLSQCTPHYIRCIKPNEKKAPNNFDTPMVAHQARYLGLLENVKVRRAGYAFRAAYDRFFFRYRVCSNRTWPEWTGDSRSGCQAILDSVQFEQKEYQMGTTKLFIRHPETVFAFEELRERRVWSYAIAIQDFFRKITGSSTQYNIAMAAHQKVSGKKERRRMSLERPYKGDYLNLRDNLTLKGIVEKYGEDKIHFADSINTYDSKAKKHRRVILLTDKTIYIIGIMLLAADKNSKVKPQTELTAQVNPFKYVLARRLELNSISSVSLSSLADNFMVINVNMQHCQIIECRKKTELLEMMSRSYSGLRFDFKQAIPVQVKDKKKLVNKNLVFETNPAGGNGTLTPQFKVQVASGLPASSAPNLQAPQKCKAVTGLVKPLESAPSAARSTPCLLYTSPSPRD
eukprot:TRINITY_DN5501_c0_g1_i2.p1 TRINITY_DN5501_c0_g1~~TRINITY_DN5501_c0_g1_i2.p1  ORF type:complete len:1059 (+),score=290.73 TRINITY_DN5501_c0_g1_i2:110-3286(+)